METHICQICKIKKESSEFYKNKIKIREDGTFQPNNGDWLCFDCGHSLKDPIQVPIDNSYNELLQEIDKAYLAGIIDGEGCIQLVKKSNNHSFDARLSITNTNQDLLDWIYKRIGGLYYKNSWTYKQPTWKERHDLIFTNQKARSILHTVLPYLVIKKPQAELVLSYFDLIGIDGRHITKSLADKREQLYLKMKELNKKGR